MSEAIHSFQSQLSGVMETVFKAAMFEITRLVEDSFVKEVSRSREQVEALKKRLQWSECKRKNQEINVKRLRCAECDKARGGDDEREELSPQSGLFTITVQLKLSAVTGCNVQEKGHLNL